MRRGAKELARGLYNREYPVYYSPMTNTITNFVAGHNAHASITPGLTVCGKRTETLEQTDRYVSCQYCLDHMPVKRDALRALVAAVRA